MSWWVKCLLYEQENSNSHPSEPICNPETGERWSLVFVRQTFSSKWKVLGLVEEKKYEDFGG